MPRGHLTPFPSNYIPIKTLQGWTALKLRTDDLGLVVGVDLPRAQDGLHVEFWSRRKDVAEHITGIVIVQENEMLRARNEALEKELHALRLSVSDRSAQQFASVS